MAVARVQSSVADVVLLRLPQIITNSVTATTWPAVTNWRSDEYLMRKLPTLNEPRIADEDESCDAESYFAPDPSGDMVTEMESNSLFEPEAPPMYFARWMGFQELAPLRADASPQQPLLIEEKVDGVYSSGARAEKSEDVVERRYFRLGTNGSASSLHHDEYHNLFAQIRGEKDWWLLPPTSWRHAKGFPKGHERARQSPRRPIFEWSSDDMAAAGAIQTKTVPGDLLYIPPYWLHQTRTTLGVSVAVNVWSPSREAQHASKALALVAGLHKMLLEGSKESGLCVAARTVHAVALSLAKEEEVDAIELLASLHAAQHGPHLRPARRGRKASSSTPTAAAKPDAACGGPCERQSDAEAAEADKLAAAFSALPAGVSTLTLADLVTELAEQVATAVSPVWPGDKGRARAVRCLLLQLQPALANQTAT